ncbi:DUF3870 domain-containing protein [Clostridium polynesiense]|uniref:DUF3870 domain-containing protein n=1 Tax=Clostridium polynesiense TaxID=1325933 RepID=UPI00058E1090|nr:DUF3870 domain-containing protein [Clostridium polynesiense]
MYDKDTLYIVGNSRTTSDNAITKRYLSFFIGFVVKEHSGEIIDVSCSFTIRTTDEFIKSLFIGRTLRNFDENLEIDVKRRYFGSSQKAIIVAYKDAVKKYQEVTGNL